MNARRGFTLIELLVGLCIAVSITAILVGVGRGWLRASTQQQYIASEVQDLSDITMATQAYMSQNATSMPFGVTSMTAGGLIVAGWLPKTFALRAPPPLFAPRAGFSPWYQGYSVLMNKKADGSTRALIYEQFAANAARLQQSGVPNTPAAIAHLKAVIATRASRQYHLSAGTLAPGSTVISGAFGGFSKDLAVDISSTVGTMLLQSSAAVLIGFPDLGANGVNNPPPPAPPPVTSLTGCNLVHPDASTGNAPTCPAGTPRQVAQWPYCAAFNNNFAHFAAYPSQAGTIVTGIVRRQAGTQRLECIDNVPEIFFGLYCSPLWDEVDAVEASIQGGRFMDESCRYKANGRMDGFNGPGCDVVGSGSMHMLRIATAQCSITTPDPSIQSLGTNGYNILCCAQ